MGIDDKLKVSHECFSRAMKERRLAQMLKEASEIVVLGTGKDTIKVVIPTQNSALTEAIRECDKTPYLHCGYGVTVHTESGRVYGTANYTQRYKRNNSSNTSD